MTQSEQAKNLKDNLTRFHLQNHGVVPENLDKLVADLIEAFEPEERV